MFKIILVNLFLNYLHNNKEEIEKMNKTHVLKNEKDQKLKKIHMKSILSEVKNKTIIQDLETIKKYNESGINFNIQAYRPNWKQWQTPKVGKKLAATNSNINAGKSLRQEILSKPLINQNPQQENNEDKSENDEERNQDQDQSDKEEKDLRENLSGRKNLYKRKSSKIQMQLKQIVKYSLMYPSRNNSQKIIQQQIEKLINKSYEITKKTKSRFSTQTHRSRTIRPTKFQSQSKKIDENMFLKIVEGYPTQEAQQDIKKHNRTKHLLKKSKALFVKNNQAHDYSLVNFIQKQITKLKIQSGRNTVSANASIQQYEQYYHPGFDIREENIIDVHRFMRGQAKNDEELSNYITTKEMRKFQNKYDIYENIYKRTKDGFNCEKLDCNQMKQLTLKNAIFLNEAYIQSNNRMRRKQIEEVMSNLRLYN